MPNVRYATIKMRDLRGATLQNAGVEMHTDAVSRGDRVLVIDDLLATGGTAAATARLVEKQGGVVEGFAFVIELDFLKGRERLGTRTIHALVHY